LNIYGEISRAFGTVKRGQTEIQNLWNLVTGTSTTVTASTGLQISTVYSCVDTISKTFASLPSSIILEEADGDRVKYKRHPLWRILTKSPYDNMTAYDSKRMIGVDYLVWGNGYQLKIRDSKYRVIGLKNIRPWDMWPVRDANHQLWYQCYDEECMGTYPASDVIHLRDIGYHPNPDMGMSKIDLHATTIGKEKAASKFINTFYSNGMFLGGVIEYPKEANIGDPEIERLRSSFKQYYGGIEKGAQIGIITGGGQLKQFKSEMPLSNAQYVESAKLNTQEICRIYSVPPPKIGFTEGTPYNSLESLNVDYWQNCILPIVTMYEQEIALKCFSEDNVYLNHNFDSVLRADTAAMSEYYTKMFKIGVYNRNEIRAKLEENKIDGGDRYFIEGNNMVPVDLIDHNILKPGSNEPGK
jgi:HK97 family phage portal protein